MTVKGGTSQACAACKHQRRKCSSDCVLAPYFPATQPKTFQNAHRLFGVSNILKTLKQIDDEDKKADAMKSIIFEADMRARFPVHGCVQYICYLNQQIQEILDETRFVRGQLARCHEQQQLMKSMDSNNNTNNYICDGGYQWTDKMIRFGSSSQSNNPGYRVPPLSNLDPISCSEYNDLSSPDSPLVFPHGENFPDYD